MFEIDQQSEKLQPPNQQQQISSQRFNPKINERWIGIGIAIFSIFISLCFFIHSENINSSQSVTLETLQSQFLLMSEKHLNQIQTIEKQINDLRKEIESFKNNANRVDVIQNDINWLKKLQENVLGKSDQKIIEQKLEIQRLKQSSELVKFEQISNLKVELLSKDLAAIRNATESTRLQKMSPSMPYITSLTNSTHPSIISSTIKPSIENYGPFVDLKGEQTIQINQSEFSYFDTTSPCVISFKGKAVVTLIATGWGQCNDCDGQAFFLKDKTLHLPYVGINGENRQIPGTQFLNSEKHPINLTMEFFIEEAGIHQFALAFNINHDTDSEITVGGLSFIAKVVYYQ